jgi:hypothetical protein
MGLHKVTVDYTIAFAQFLRIASPAAAFSLLSSGADPTGRTRLAFARYKGEAQKRCLRRGFPAFKSSGLLTSIRWTRKEPNFGYRLLRRIYPAFRMLFPNHVIRADDLAHAIGGCCLPQNGQTRRHILENRDIRAMVAHCRVAPTPAASPDPHE